MNEKSDKRLNELEAKYSFQEDSIERLSNELRRQQQEISFLKEELKSLKENQKNDFHENKDEKPPHY
tara:strand:- start:254 stop:454 length:201 start_codon:yes stop_codon:yes gene_type:complete